MVQEIAIEKTGNKTESQKNINDLFIRAARDGKLWQVKSLIRISQIGARDGYGKSALDYSNENGHDNISKFIINNIPYL